MAHPGTRITGNITVVARREDLDTPSELDWSPLPLVQMVEDPFEFRPRSADSGV